MKKLIYAKTNGYDLVFSTDYNGNCRYLLENLDFPINPTEQKALDFLTSVEDDSSWKDDCSIDEIRAGVEEVLAELKKEI